MTSKQTGLLRSFPKDKNGLYIVYDCFTFDNLFRLLLKTDNDHEEALLFILGQSSLSALVFQERIHNRAYRRLTTKEALPPEEASRKARLIYDFLSITKR